MSTFQEQVISNSEADDWNKARTEWTVSDYKELDEPAVCISGYATTKHPYTLHNKTTDKTLDTVGALTVELLAQTTSSDRADGIDKTTLERLQKEMKKVRLSKEPPSTCHMPGCTEEVHGPFCREHDEMCRAQAQYRCPFKGQKGKTWADIMTNNANYCKWVAETIGGHDHEQYGDRNRARDGYIRWRLAESEM